MIVAGRRRGNMLEKLVIKMEEEILQKNNLHRANGLLDELQGHGVEIIIGDTGELSEEDMENTLYITDSEEEYRALRKRGRYVLPYRHEENTTADFTGALYVLEQIAEADYSTVDMAYRRLAGLPWEILQTGRCVIRETTLEDVEAFYRIYEEDSITEYMENLFEDLEEEIAYTKDYIERVYGFYGYGMWTVLEKENGQVIGRAGVSWREGFDLPELGFVIGVPWQRQGYAYEVCSAILDYAKEELGMDRVQALVMEGNQRSEMLCQKLGFVESGERARLDREMYTVWIKNLYDSGSV